MSEWRDIESAPKDGTRILVWEVCEPVIVWWDANHNWWRCDLKDESWGGPDESFAWSEHLVIAPITHWIPLPRKPDE